MFSFASARLLVYVLTLNIHSNSGVISVLINRLFKLSSLRVGLELVPKLTMSNQLLSVFYHFETLTGSLK